MLFRELWAQFQSLQRYNLNFIASLNDVTIKQPSLRKVECSSIVFLFILCAIHLILSHFALARPPMLFGPVIPFSAVEKICCLQLNSLLIPYEIPLQNIIYCIVEMEALIIILYSRFVNIRFTESENRWESDNSTDIIGCRSCLEAFILVLFSRRERGMMPVDIGLYFRLIKSK